MIRLTITIPTYNRPSFLEKTLEILAPQSHPEVELIVVDNASSSPVSRMVNEVLGVTSWNFQCETNPVNVGMGANLLRCFEKGSGDFLWLLSDDDQIEPDCVATLVKVIREHPHFDFGVFPLKVLPPLPIRAFENLDSFLLNLDSSAPLVFISSALFRRKRLLPFLHKAYEFVDSGAPHSALVLYAGGEITSFRCQCFDKTIVEWVPPPKEERYSSFTPIGQTKLASILSSKVRPHFQTLLRKNCASPSRLLLHLLRDNNNGSDHYRSRMILREYISAYAKVSGQWRSFVLVTFFIPIGVILLCFSKPILVATLALARFVGRPISLDPSPVNLWDYRRVGDSSDHEKCNT